MAGAVGAATGIVSTTANIIQSGQQRKAAKRQAEVQQYAQEVQYMQEKAAIEQQKRYAQLTRDVEAVQLAAQDTQQRNALNEQALQNQLEESQLGYQVAQKQLQDKAALSTAKSALDLAEYQQGELYRNRLGQAEARQSDAANQISQATGELAKYLQENDMNRAAAWILANAGGQQDSLTSNLMQDPGAALRAQTTNESALEGAQTQRDLEVASAAIQRQLGLGDVAMERLGAQTQYDVNSLMTSAQQDLLGTGARKNRLAEGIANSTLDGGIKLRDQQRGIDAAFSDMGYQAQVNNAGIRNAGILSSLQAQQQANKGSLFTSLANIASIAGAGYNAYQMMKPLNQPVQRVYQSPVVGAPQQQQDTRYNYNFDGGNIYG